ncbi:MAG: PKD domain-containing protein [Ardenticatenaceae bacterium]|nr:PKD domain-containing protein [Ardenticatenaceae bacterium]
MTTLKLPQKLILAVCTVAALVTAWQIVRGLAPPTDDPQRLAAQLLPDSGQPIQLGATLSAEAVEIGDFVTLTLIVRNNQPVPLEPKVAVELPAAVQFEAAHLAEDLLLNETDHALWWYPALAANGGVAVRELSLLALQPTVGEQPERLTVLLSDGRESHTVVFPFWSGQSLSPTAVFQPNDAQVAVGQQVQFANSSLGQAPLSFQWDFGDGQTATAAEPRHVYTEPGQYVVQLTVQNSLGQASHTVPITVGTPPVVQLDLSQQIYAQAPFVAQAFSDGSETNLQWQMGDGAVHDGFWVEHSYAQPGEYVVRLTATNPFGSSSASALVVVQASDLNPNPPTVPATAVPQTAATSDYMALPIQLQANAEVDALPLPQQLLWYTNEARRQAGQPAVTLSFDLSQAAQVHANDAANNFVVDHIGSDGTNPYDRVERAGYVDGFLIGEVTAWGFNTARSAVQFWLDSPEHRRTLLNPLADEIGAAEATNYDSQYVWHWVIEFTSYELPGETAVTYLSPTITPTPPPTATAAHTATPTPTGTATATATPTATGTTLPTATPTETATPTFTPTASPTFTPTSTPTATFTPTPTETGERP